MEATTEKLLKGMRFLAWLAFIVFLIKAGAILMAFGVSVNASEAAKDLYRGMDLSRYENYSFIQYTIIVFYYIFLNLLQAYMALFTAKLISAIHQEKSFHAEISGLLHKIRYSVLGVFTLALLHNIHMVIIEKYAAITPDYIAIEYFFFAGLVYVLAELFIRTLLKKNTTV